MKILKVIKSALQRIVRTIRNIFIHSNDTTTSTTAGNSYAEYDDMTDMWNDATNETSIYPFITFDYDLPIFNEDETINMWFHEHNGLTKADTDSIFKHDEKIDSETTKTDNNNNVRNDIVTHANMDDNHKRNVEKYGDMLRNLFNEENTTLNKERIRDWKDTYDIVQYDSDSFEYFRNRGIENENIIFKDNYYELWYYDISDLAEIYDYDINDDGRIYSKLKCSRPEKIDFLKSIPYFRHIGNSQSISEIMSERRIITDYVIMPLNSRRGEPSENILSA